MDQRPSTAARSLRFRRAPIMAFGSRASAFANLKGQWIFFDVNGSTHACHESASAQRTLRPAPPRGACGIRVRASIDHVTLRFDYSIQIALRASNSYVRVLARALASGSKLGNSYALPAVTTNQCYRGWYCAGNEAQIEDVGIGRRLLYELAWIAVASRVLKEACSRASDPDDVDVI